MYLQCSLILAHDSLLGVERVQFVVLYILLVLVLYALVLPSSLDTNRALDYFVTNLSYDMKPAAMITNKKQTEHISTDPISQKPYLWP